MKWKDLETGIAKLMDKAVQRLPVLYLRLYDTRSAGNFIPPQPCDFLIWPAGRPTVFLEAKHSMHAESLRSVFSGAVSDGQIASARLAHRAGRTYRILFQSAATGQCEVWDGFYCSERRSLGKPLELHERFLYASLNDAVYQGILGLSEAEQNRVQRGPKH